MRPLLRKRVCKKCNNSYIPTGLSQRFCKGCGIINEKEIARKYESRPEVIAKRRERDRSKKAQARYARYRATSNYKKKALKRYQEMDENVKKAHYAITNAIRDKKLIRATHCQQCGIMDWGDKRSMIEAHHYKGYEPNHWLDVQWLCVPCHKEADRRKEGELR